MRKFTCTVAAIIALAAAPAVAQVQTEAAKAATQAAVQAVVSQGTQNTTSAITTTTDMATKDGAVVAPNGPRDGSAPQVAEPTGQPRK